MELLEGETLAERLCRGPMPLEQVLRYGATGDEGALPLTVVQNWTVELKKK